MRESVDLPCCTIIHPEIRYKRSSVRCVFAWLAELCCACAYMLEVFARCVA